MADGTNASLKSRVSEAEWNVRVELAALYRDAESTARALVNQMMLSGLLVDAGDERVRVEPVARTAYDAAR